MNVEQVNTFISLVYRSESSWIALCLIPPHARQPEHRFMTVDDLSRFLGYARYRNAHGWGIYITPSVLKPNPRNRRKGSFEDWQTVIYLDCDGPHCLDRIKQRYPYPTLVVRTSRGRYQLYWRLEQPVSIAQQEQLMSAMAMDVDADRAATDVSRVLRLPSFWNRKPGRDNTVDIVFTRDHAVPYRSLSERGQPSACRDCVPKTLTSTDSNPPLVLGGSKGPDSKSTRALSESERDWYEVHRQLALGRAPQDVVYWLRGKRIDKPNPTYYALLTVSKAVRARTGPNRHASKPNPEHAKSRGMCQYSNTPTTRRHPNHNWS
jgi:hypothetical protein